MNMINFDKLLADLDTLDLNQVRMVHACLQNTYDKLLRKVSTNFQLGDVVSFIDKRGVTRTGTVVKINQKNIKVSVGNGGLGNVTWNVSATLLKKAA